MRKKCFSFSCCSCVRDNAIRVIPVRCRHGVPVPAGPRTMAQPVLNLYCRLSRHLLWAASSFSAPVLRRTTRLRQLDWNFSGLPALEEERRKKSIADYRGQLACCGPVLLVQIPACPTVRVPLAQVPGTPQRGLSAAWLKFSGSPRVPAAANGQTTGRFSLSPSGHWLLSPVKFPRALELAASILTDPFHSLVSLAWHLIAIVIILHFFSYFTFDTTIFIVVRPHP